MLKFLRTGGGGGKGGSKKSRSGRSIQPARERSDAITAEDVLGGRAFDGETGSSVGSYDDAASIASGQSGTASAGHTLIKPSRQFPERIHAQSDAAVVLLGGASRAHSNSRQRTRVLERNEEGDEGDEEQSEATSQASATSAPDQTLSREHAQSSLASQRPRFETIDVSAPASSAARRRSLKLPLLVAEESNASEDLEASAQEERGAPDPMTSQTSQSQQPVQAGPSRTVSFRDRNASGQPPPAEADASGDEMSVGDLPSEETLSVDSVATSDRKHRKGGKGRFNIKLPKAIRNVSRSSKPVLGNAAATSAVVAGKSPKHLAANGGVAGAPLPVLVAGAEGGYSEEPSNPGARQGPSERERLLVEENAVLRESREELRAFLEAKSIAMEQLQRLREEDEGQREQEQHRFQLEKRLLEEKLKAAQDELTRVEEVAAAKIDGSGGNSVLLEEYKAKADALQGRIAELEKQIADWTESMVKLTTENRSLKAQLEQATVGKKTMGDLSAAKMSEVKELREELEREAAESRELKAKLEAAEVVISDLRRENTRLSKELSEESDAYSRERQESARVHDEMRASNKQLSSRVEELEEELASALNHGKKLAEDLETFRKQKQAEVAALDRALSEEREAKRRLAAEVKSLKSQCAELSAMLSDRRATVSELEARVTALQEERAAALRKSPSQPLLASGGSPLSHSPPPAQTSEGQMQLAGGRRASISYSAAAAARTDELQRLLAMARDQIAMLEARVQEMQDERNATASRWDELQSALRNTEQEGTHDEETLLLQKVAELEANRSQLEAELEEQRHEVSTAQRLLRERAAAAEASERQAAELRESLHHVEEELERLGESLEARESQLNEARTRCRTLETQSDATRLELARLQAEKESMSEQLKHLNATLEAEKQAGSKQRQEAGDKVAQLTAELGEAQSKLRSASRRMSVDQAKAAELERLREQMRSLESERKKAAKQRNDLQEAYDHERSELNSVTADRARLEREVNALNKKVGELEMRRKELESQLDSANEKARRESIRAEEELMKVQSQVRALQSERIFEKEQLQQKLSLLESSRQTQLNALMDTVQEEHKEQLRVKEKQISRVEEEKAEAEAALAKLKKTVASLQATQESMAEQKLRQSSQYAAETTALQAKVANLESQIRSLEGRKADLQKDLEKSQKERAALEEDNEALNERLQDLTAQFEAELASKTAAPDPLAASVYANANAASEGPPSAEPEHPSRLLANVIVVGGRVPVRVPVVQPLTAALAAGSGDSDNADLATQRTSAHRARASFMSTGASLVGGPSFNQAIGSLNHSTPSTTAAVVCILKNRLVQCLFEKANVGEPSLPASLFNRPLKQNDDQQGSRPPLARILSIAQNLWELAEDLRLGLVQSDTSLSSRFRESHFTVADWNATLTNLRGSAEAVEKRNRQLEEACNKYLYAVKEARASAQLEREKYKTLSRNLHRQIAGLIAQNEAVMQQRDQLVVQSQITNLPHRPLMAIAPATEDTNDEKEASDNQGTARTSTPVRRATPITGGVTFSQNHRRTPSPRSAQIYVHGQDHSPGRTRVSPSPPRADPPTAADRFSWADTHSPAATPGSRVVSVKRNTMVPLAPIKPSSVTPMSSATTALPVTTHRYNSAAGGTGGRLFLVSKS